MYLMVFRQIMTKSQGAQSPLLDSVVYVISRVIFLYSVSSANPIWAGP